MDIKALRESLRAATRQDDVAKLLWDLLPEGHQSYTYAESAAKIRKDDPDSEFADLLDEAEARWVELDPVRPRTRRG